MTVVNCDVCGLPIEADSDRGAAVKLGTHRRNEHGIIGKNASAKAKQEWQGPPTESAVPESADPESLFAPSAPADEVAPVRGGAPRSAPDASLAPRRGLAGWRDRLRGPKKPKPVQSGPEKAPKPAKSRGPFGKRISAADTISDIYGLGGSILRQTGRVPTGRVLEFQGPAAGEMLDEVIKGTALDRFVIQRIVGARSTLDVMIALAGPPLLTWQMESAITAGDQERFTRLELALKSVIKNSLPTMVPAMKRARAKEAASQAALADLLDESDLATLGVSIVDGQPRSRDTGQVVDVGDIFVAMLFSEWEPPTSPAQPDQEVMTDA